MAHRLTTPTLSIVLPAYNAASFLEDALRSIFTQTFTAFELIVVNDGSTDKTGDILRHIADPRLRVITQENKGLVAALQVGIAAARAPLIARHDADDRSEPTRFATQVAFLGTHPEVVLLGSSMQTMNMTGKVLHSHYVLLNNAELKQELLVRSPFAHGSVVFRRDAYEKSGGYQQNDWPAEDYGLWLRMAAEGEFANLDEPLYIYRENEAGISSQNTATQQAATQRIQQKAWQQRRSLTPPSIDKTTYLDKPMGQFRLTRIQDNLRMQLVQALQRIDLRIALRVLRLMFPRKNT